jgi:anti-sigma regulatory factor (Ser/Thr protein kinase)
VTSKRSFSAYEKSVAEARHFVSGFTADLPPDLQDSVALMVSELVTNALVHGSSGFDVAVDRSADQVRVSVSDRGDGTPEVRSPDSTEPHGRGLQIVEALSDEWGIIPNFAAGKTVWFQVSPNLVTQDAPEYETTGATPSNRPDRAEQRSARLGSSADMAEYGDSDRTSVNSAKSLRRQGQRRQGQRRQGQRRQGQRRQVTGACGRRRPAIWLSPLMATLTGSMDWLVARPLPRQRRCFVGTRCDHVRREESGGRGIKSGRDRY